jgi:2-C-methyl-D-erythritol 2,4-cyclodiphosphate synthase
MSDARVGQGFDIHRFSDDPTRTLVLGGVSFDGPGLDGHSDADVVAHAAAMRCWVPPALRHRRALPDTDPQWKGADSLQLLARVGELVREAGWSIGNVDCSVVCEAPKLAPHRAVMQANLSKACGAPVSVKDVVPKDWVRSGGVKASPAGPSR